MRISRDLDSCMIFLEVAAVKEWLDSDKIHSIGILAGMWGIKLHDDHVIKS